MARMKFLIVTIVLLGVEIYLMLYCKDEFAKTYLAAGVLVLMVCTFFYTLVPEGFWMLPFLVAIAFTGIEMMKYFGLFYEAHLYKIPFFKAILGSNYDFKRIVAFFVGAAMAVVMSRVSTEN